MNIFTFVVCILAFAMITVWEIDRCNIDFVETIPVNICGLIVILHVLACVNALSAIDYINCGIITFLGFCYRKKSVDRLLLQKKIVNKSSLVFLIVSAVIILGLYSKRICSYDDFKFWAASAKAMFYQNGYGVPYTNIASQYFGDYPLGATLIQWFFEHIVGSFHESVLYICQSIVTFSFLIPLIKKIPKWSYVLPAVVIIISFCSGFTRFGMSLAPDRTMGVIFGASLILVIDIYESGKTFYKYAFSLYLATICLMKSIGFLWAVFAIIFYLYYLDNTFKEKLKTIIQITLLPGMVYFSWNIYCRLAHRYSYLTENAYNGASRGLLSQLAYIRESFYIVKLFFRTLLFESINGTTGLISFSTGLNMSVVGLFLFFAAVSITLVKLGDFNRKTIVKINVYYVFVVLVYFFLLLWSFIFMFGNEFEDNNAARMVSLISRYGEPGLICGWMLLMKVLLENENKDSFHKGNAWKGKLRNRLFAGNNWIVALVICLLIVNIPFSFTILFGHNWNSQIFEVNEEERVNNINYFESVLAQEEGIEDKCGARILYCDPYLSVYRYSYLHYFLAPISTINYSDKIDVTVFNNMAEEYKCNYIFVADTYKDTTDEETIKNYTMEKSLKFNTLYRIMRTEKGLNFCEVKG